MKFLFSLLFCCVSVSYAQFVPYRLVNQKGKAVSLNALKKSLKKADVVFIGEYHNNTFFHWLSLQILKTMYLTDKKLIFGCEMLEAHQQNSVDEYFQGKLSEEEFLKKEKLWPNHLSDYQPLLRFCKENQIPIIATNIPRKYASITYKNSQKALLELPEAEKKFIVPLPFSVPYENKTYQVLGDSLFIEAQAIKDATMSYFIQKNLKQGYKFLHLNGSYHSDYHEGIVDYLKKSQPNLKILTFSLVTQSQLKVVPKEDLEKADFLFILPKDHILSYE